MKILRAAPVFLALVLATLNATTAHGQDKTFGQKIDDVTITAEVKAKLAAEKLSNLTRISVKSDNGIVTLSGTVDTPERKALAAQLASQVKGVKAVVNKIDVASAGSSGSTASSSAAAGPAASTQTSVDATGVVARVDQDSRTITLQDGRVLKANDRTAVWQRTRVDDLKSGTQVLVRGAAPVGYQPAASMQTPDWWMGTVSRVDSGSNQIVLADGTVVRVTPSTNVHRGTERLTLAQLESGSEVVVRLPSTTASGAAGSALPSQTGTGRTIEASDVNVVWMPSAQSR